MRRYLPSFLLALAAFGPFTLLSQTGCDALSKLKGDAADAGIDANALLATAAAVDGAAAVPVDTNTTPTTTATPLTPGTSTIAPGPTTTTTTVRPADGGVKTDAAAPVDAGGKTDAAAPSPTPTFTIPAFDAGRLTGFDAGGFKPPWVK